MSQSVFTVDGAKVRLMRDRAGYTQSKFAQMVKTHPTYLGKIERGKRQPGIELRNRIAEQLGVDLDEIAAAALAANVTASLQNAA